MPPAPWWGSISYGEDIPCNPTVFLLDTRDQVERKKQWQLKHWPALLQYVPSAMKVLFPPFQHTEVLPSKGL